jgi:hypothetical protein
VRANDEGVASRPKPSGCKGRAHCGSEQVSGRVLRQSSTQLALEDDAGAMAVSKLSLASDYKPKVVREA